MPAPTVRVRAVEQGKPGVTQGRSGIKNRRSNAGNFSKQYGTRVRETVPNHGVAQVGKNRAMGDWLAKIWPGQGEKEKNRAVHESFCPEPWK